MTCIYAGVTCEALQEERLRRDCKLLLPGVAASRSVLRSYLDRDVLNASVCYWSPNLSIFHAITADGRPWISGAQQMSSEGIADFREDQGPRFPLLFGASEEIFGIPITVSSTSSRCGRSAASWLSASLTSPWQRTSPTRSAATSTASNASPLVPAISHCCQQVVFRDTFSQFKEAVDPNNLAVRHWDYDTGLMKKLTL